MTADDGRARLVGVADRYLAPAATIPVVIVAATTAVAMLVLTARYGYHRDEP